MTIFTGINHLAMVTADMDRTVRFWRDLLGMPLVLGTGRPGYRQYFFSITDRDMIAFFEWTGAEPVAEKDHGVPRPGPLAFDHVSFGVKSPEALWSLQDRLESNDFWVSEVVDHGFILSVYTFDPNAIPIEFSFSVPEFEVRRVPLMLDSDPVPSAREGCAPRPGHWRLPTDPPLARKAYPGEAEAFVAAYSNIP